MGDPSVTTPFTPNHSSWLNHIEVWFSILVCNTSKAYLPAKILAFVDYFNRTLANLFKGNFNLLKDRLISVSEY